MVEKDGRIYLRRVSMNLPEPLLIDVQELALKLRRSGTQVSLSALVEVALKELVARDNVVATVRKHGASARRNVNGLNGAATDRKLIMSRVRVDGRAS